MENRKFVISILLTFLFLPLFVFAYEPDTAHKGLTRDMVRFYDNFHPGSFSAEEKTYIEKGSVDEDSGTRALNHFYDPVHNVGIFGNYTSKVWATDTLAQARKDNSFTASLGVIARGYYSFDTDYSWERAIYEYVHGDKKRGLESLGHVLHLLEDATVPDHTRDDPHPPFFDSTFNQQSPYEWFTNRFNADNIDVYKKLIAGGQKPVYFESIEKYFDVLANYSNANFFSKDTVLDEKYLNPTVQDEIYKKLSNNKYYKFAIHNDHLLIWIVSEKKNISTGEIEREYAMKDPDLLILTDYWNLLSKQAVIHGAGVIKLFFDEVEKERRTLALYNKNKSLIEKTVDQLASAVSSIFGSSVEPVDTLGSNLSANVLSALENSSLVETQETDNTTPTESPAENGEQNEVSITPIVSNQTVPTTTIPSSLPPSDNVPMPKINFGDGISPGFGGGGGPSVVPATTPTTPVLVLPDTPGIVSPTVGSRLFATTTVSFSGTSTVGFIISNNFSTTTVVTDGSGIWSFTFTGFSEGTTTLNFIATDSSGATSSPKEISVFVDTVLPFVPILSIPACSHSIRSSSCLVPITNITVTPASSSTDISFYEILVNGSVSATSTSSTNVSLGNGVSSLQTVAVDGVGNRATSSAISVETTSLPIVINEVAWAGTNASASDEWMELYNRSGVTLQLSSLTLASKDGVPYIPLSGTLANGAYYLIERTNDSTVSNISASLVIAFSGLDGGSGLSNDGEELELIYWDGVSSTTIDSTPVIATCSGWCGGATASSTSMERRNPANSGTDSSNWGSNNTYTKNGLDSASGTIYGTPKSRNSINLKTVGYYCPPYTSTYEEGSYYEHIGQFCHYLSSGFSGTRYGDIYRGVLASSTLKNGHLLSGSDSTQMNDNLSGPIQSEDIFVAIYEVHSGLTSEITAFRNFFQTGANAPPHLDYGMLRFKYGTAP